jgi:hypothetical protein
MDPATRRDDLAMAAPLAKRISHVHAHGDSPTEIENSFVSIGRE